MKTSLQNAVSIVALTIPQLVSAVVHVEMKYVTEWHTRTGSPPTHTPMPNGLLSESAEGKTLSKATIPASLVSPATSASVTTPASSSTSSPVSSPVSSPASSSASVATLFTSSTSVATSATSSASVVTSAAAQATGVMNIAIKNNWPHPLSVSYGDNDGSPPAVGNPTAGPLGTSTVVSYPTNWAGRIYIGKTVNSADSKIEGSTMWAPDIDVSYVDGYSVPITCSNANEPVTGCNIDLWTASDNCTNMVGEQDVCLNPMQGVADGPADPWFLPCQGAAYTFPNDNIANNGDTRTSEIACCIGTEEMGCKAPERQGKGNNKASKAKRASLSDNEQRLAPKDGGEVDTHDQIPSLKPHAAAHAHSHLARHLNGVRSYRHGFARRPKDVV